MSENTKLFSRPKVRFSQFSDKKYNNEIIEESRKDDTNLQTNGPKIKSIITLKRPIRIVNSIKSVNACEKDLPAKNCEIKNSACSHDTAFENTQDTSLSNDNMPETMVSRILCNANSSEDKEKNDKFLQLNKNTRIQHNTSKYCRKALQQKGKENKDMILNKIISNKNKIKIKNSQYKQPTICKKLKLSTSSNDIQKIDDTNSKRAGMTKSRSVPSIIKKTEKHINKIRTFDTKPTLSNVMPCYKYINAEMTRDKVSPIKKTVLYDTTGPKIKTFVGSGIYHKQQNDIKTDDLSKKCCVMSDTVKKLAQPEYNSIMCTFNKLKETKQQKIAKDINDLPPIQKNLLNGKISTALDFPLDEVIFKNLVDLCIDDKQVSTVMRSKDPEPRQKDIMPKLSDFFVPEQTKDICTFVQVKFRAPKINENWDIFKISNKIFDWRHSLDNVR